MNSRCIALGIIDPQRGFMPATEGLRLNNPGFGELPVSGGEAIVPYVNQLLGAFALGNALIFTTQDWHPNQTTHFADQPDFSTTWPRHCVANTPGAEIHPEIIAPATTVAFKKGVESLKAGEIDVSYSGYSSHNKVGESLSEWLTGQGVSHVYLGGLALDYCVGQTALDLRRQLDLEVTLVSNATCGIAEPSTDQMRAQFKQFGINELTAQQVVRLLERSRDED